MELRFDAILQSELGNDNSDADHIKCSHRPQVPIPGQDHLVFQLKKRQTLSVCENIALTTVLFAAG